MGGGSHAPARFTVTLVHSMTCADAGTRAGKATARVRTTTSRLPYATLTELFSAQRNIPPDPVPDKWRESRKMGQINCGEFVFCPTSRRGTAPHLPSLLKHEAGCLLVPVVNEGVL